MKYMPRVESMNRVASAPLGPEHTIVLFDQIKSAGAVQYAFLAAVFDNKLKQPVYFVASEVNSMAQVLGGGTHYLGIFDDDGHANLGASDDWGDPRKFFPEALRIASGHFGMKESDS